MSIAGPSQDAQLRAASGGSAAARAASVEVVIRVAGPQMPPARRALAVAGLRSVRGRGRRRVRHVRAGQTIYKCRDADGRVTYSGTACAGEGGKLGAAAQARGRGANLAANAEPAVPSSLTAPVSIPGPRTALPKRCDNAASLQPVIARLESAATPDDVRGFLAEERLRLVRCEYTRLTAGEWREREQRMRDVDARDAARRQAAVARIDALYDQYLTPAEQAVRMRSRGR